MFEKEKENLVAELIKSGIKDKAVLEVIRITERNLFVPDEYSDFAWDNSALKIGFGQTISQPYTVAVMTIALEVFSGCCVLEIGTGSGYQAAILEELGCNVFSIERNKFLFERTEKLLKSLGYKTNCLFGDGSVGYPEYAPYDRIIVTAAAPVVPELLKEQLAVGGKLVIPVGERKIQNIEVITRMNENAYEYYTIPGFVFVPLIGEDAWKEE